MARNGLRWVVLVLALSLVAGCQTRPPGSGAARVNRGNNNNNNNDRNLREFDRNDELLQQANFLLGNEPGQDFLRGGDELFGNSLATPAFQDGQGALTFPGSNPNFSSSVNGFAQGVPQGSDLLTIPNAARGISSGGNGLDATHGSSNNQRRPVTQ